MSHTVHIKSTSADLCDALALVAQRICSPYIDPIALQPLSACGLIALDRCPGMRPIGMGEVAQRIIGRAIISIVKDDVQAVTGTVQLCAGQDSRCEEAVHDEADL